MSARRHGKPAATESKAGKSGGSPSDKSAVRTTRTRVASGCKAESPVDDLKEAQAILRGFTRTGVAQREKRPVNFNDRVEVHTLELLGNITADPRTSDSAGAWLHRLKDRGAGHCTPLHGAAEGLHVLVLDARAVAELWEAAAAHRASVASYERLQKNLSHLRNLRGGSAGMDGAD